MRPPSKPFEIVLALAILLAPFLLIGLIMRWTDLALILAIALLVDVPIAALGFWLRRKRERI